MTLEQQQREAAFQKHQAQQQRDEELDVAAKEAALHLFQRLDRLTRDADFLWFLENEMLPTMHAEEMDALNLKRSAYERDLSAHRADMAKTFCELTAERMAFWKGQAGLA